MKTAEETVQTLMEQEFGAKNIAPMFPTGDTAGQANYRRLMLASIEADRAQRAARLEDLHAYDYFQMDEDEGREERIGIVQIDTTPGIGRLRVYINDGRIFDGDPETGQEWSLT